MTQTLFGIIIALFCSFGFAIWNLPRKYTLHIPQEIHNIYYGIGLSFLGIIFLLFSRYEIFLHIDKILIGLFSGVVIVIGTFLFFLSIEKNGFSLANSFKNTQAIFAYLWGGIFLGEFYSTHPLFVFLGSLLIAAVGLLLYSSSFSEFKKHSGTIFYAILTGVFYSFGVMLRKIVGNIGLICLTQGISFIIGFYLFSILKNKTYKFPIKRKPFFFATLSSFIVGLTILGFSYTYKFIEFSIAYAITNISTIWIIAIGIFFTKELNFKEYKMKLILSLLIACIAIILLYFSKVFV